MTMLIGAAAVHSCAQIFPSGKSSLQPLVLKVAPYFSYYMHVGFEKRSVSNHMKALLNPQSSPLSRAPSATVISPLRKTKLTH